MGKKSFPPTYFTVEMNKAKRPSDSSESHGWYFLADSAPVIAIPVPFPFKEHVEVFLVPFSGIGKCGSLAPA